MKFNKKILLTCGTSALLMHGIINIALNTNWNMVSNALTKALINNNHHDTNTVLKERNISSNTSRIKTATNLEDNYIDTKHKSADGQFLINIGLFSEHPIYQNGEKIKNVLYADSSFEYITEENLSELHEICLSGPYKYDEIYIKLEENHCLNYNPFSNKLLYGTIDKQHSFSGAKEFSVSTDNM